MTPAIHTTDDLCRLTGVPFSDQQLAAITAPLEPGVIVAGAGSGKTTVMAARVVWLVGTGAVRPDQVLGLTFTNKAATELGQRVRDYLAKAGLGRDRSARRAVPTGHDEDDELEPTVLTYHSYAARLLEEHGLRIGHEPDTRVMADASRFQLAELAVRRHRHPVRQLTTSTAHVVRYLLDLDAQLSEHLVTPDEVRQWQRAERPHWESGDGTKAVQQVVDTMAAREELLRLVEDYRAVKAERGVMDFSDQMALAARLAEASVEVGREERSRFAVVLLDEYQDTSVAQARLLRALFGSGIGPDGLGHPVTAVGDPCQAIYGWRGASAGNIRGFARDFPPPRETDRAQSTRFALSVNRRSQLSILEAANALAAELYADDDTVQPLSPRSGAGEGLVRGAVVETFDDELAFLAREVPRAHAQMPVPRWSEIGVLVRDNKSAAAVHDALVAADVPVEVVGLNGLLAMPEVAEVVATLEVLHDVTANAALLQLLTGPRWNIGPRDLALLGRRARVLAGTEAPPAGDLATALEEAVAGTDPADVVSLLEAMQSPGEAPYSTAARDRFASLGSELRQLQRYVGEPLLDLVRRVIDTTGIDVELAASNTRVASARRDNLSTFLDAVSAFAGAGDEASLPGLLAYLRAEEDYGQGLSLAVPTEADSVKLLTVHKAKGLEWDVVFVPGLACKVFPSAQGRSRWTTVPAELPWPLRGDAGDLPTVEDCTRKALTAFVEDCKRHNGLEERRLAYVAFTRARFLLVGSAHWWGPEQAQLRGPSEFMHTLLDCVQRSGGEPDELCPPPPEGAQNPSNRRQLRHPWPQATAGDELERRHQAAALVEAARASGWQAAAAAADDALLLDEAAEVQQWDLELDRLVEEARRDRADAIVVPLPASLSATTMLRLQDDPERLARDLARPMPRKPSASARFGTRFHAWVEAHVGQQQLLDPAELPGRADHDISGDAELQELIEAFSRGPFGDREPYQVEAPFSLVVAGQLVRGRIDAVYETDKGFLVVDWKTNRDQDADPLQLAIYRLAWADLHNLEPVEVEAGFYYVRSGELVTFDDLPDRDALTRLLTP